MIKIKLEVIGVFTLLAPGDEAARAMSHVESSGRVRQTNGGEDSKQCWNCRAVTITPSRSLSQAARLAKVNDLTPSSSDSPEHYFTSEYILRCLIWDIFSLSSHHFGCSGVLTNFAPFTPNSLARRLDEPWFVWRSKIIKLIIDHHLESYTVIHTLITSRRR